MKRPTELTRMLAALGLAVALPAGAAETKGSWPIFRGDPQLTGVAQVKLPLNLEPLWVFEAGEGGIEAAAAIDDGRVFVGTMDGILHAVDLETGKALWSYSTDGADLISYSSVE